MPPSLDYALALCDDDPMAPRPTGLTKAFGAIVDTARRARVRIAVCGALARNAYLRPRTTDDADFLVKSLADARKLAEAARGTFETRGGVDLITRLAHRRSAATVDLIVAEYPFEFEALAKARIARLQSRSVRVVSPEALAAMKVDAASDPRRTHDFGEVMDLLLSGAADQARVDAVVRRDLPACIPTWETIVRAVERARAAPPKPRGRRH